MDTVLNKLSTRTKVMGSTLLLLFIFLLTSLQAILSMAEIGEELEAITHHDIALTEKITLVTEHQLEQAIHFERGVKYGILMPVAGQDGFTTLDPERMSQHFQSEKEEFAELSQLIERDIALAQSIAHDAAGSDETGQAFNHILSQLTDIRQDHAEFERHVYDVFRLFDQQRLEQGEHLAEQVEEEENRLDSKLKALLKEIEGLTLQASERALQHEMTALSTQISSVILAVIVGLLLSWAVARNVVRRLSETGKVMEKIAEGDLTGDIQVQGNDEIAQLKRTMRTMQKALRAMVQKIDDVTVHLSGASDELAQIMADTRNSTREQQTETSHLMSALDNMGQTVHQVAQSVGEVSRSAIEADQQTHQCNALMGNAVGHINELSGQLQQSSQDIAALESQAETISGVLEVIRSIADQTNLLALNAAIEAARAGESGRGFAVVADEVRVLAGRTQESTLEINDIIEQLQNGASQAAASMQQSRGKAEDVVSQTQALSEALDTVAHLMNDISRQLADASQEQNQVLSSLNQKAVNVGDWAQQNAVAAEQTAATGAELAEMADGLKQLVSRFRIQSS